MKKYFTSSIVAVITASAFFITSICSDFAYAVSVDNQNINREIPAETKMPLSYGKITDSLSFDSKNTIINIQDVHCNPEVQRNIYNILGYLHKNDEITKIFLEGASGEMDFSSFYNIKDEPLREKILESLIDKGRLTGTEYFAIKNNVKVYGIEDSDVYNRNLNNLLFLQENRSDITGLLQELKESISVLENDYLGNDNKRLGKFLDRYKKNDISPGKFYSFLDKQISKLNSAKKNQDMDYSFFENINRFKAVKKLEKRINKNKINEEISLIVEELKNKLSYKEYSDLLAATDSFSDLSLIVPAVHKISENKGIDLSRYKNFNGYAAIYAIMEKTNPLSLFHEEMLMINEIRIASASNADECNIIYLSYMADLLENMLTNKMLYSELNDFNFKFPEFFNVLNMYYPEYDGSELSGYMKAAEDFYNINVKRNDIFFKNVSGEISSEDKNTFVLITGGFHSDGLKQLFADKDISYLTITPNITEHLPEFDSTYEQIIAGSFAHESSFAPIPLAQAKKDVLINTFLETYKDMKFKENTDVEKFVKVMTDFINIEVSKDIPGYYVLYKIYEDKFEIIYPDGLINEFNLMSFSNKKQSKIQTYSSKTVRNINSIYSSDNLYYNFVTPPDHRTIVYIDPIIRSFKYSSTNFQRFWIKSGEFIKNAAVFSGVISAVLIAASFVIALPAVYLAPLVPLFPMLIYYTAKAGGVFSEKIKKTFNLKTNPYETSIKINKDLNIEYDETLKKGEYFYADTEKKVIKANKQIFDIYNNLPVSKEIKNFLLHITGVIGHEKRHLEGKGEFEAYSFQFGLPLLGLFSACIIAQVFTVSFFPVFILFFSLLVLLDSVVFSKDLNNIKNKIVAKVAGVLLPVAIAVTTIFYFSTISYTVAKYSYVLAPPSSLFRNFNEDTQDMFIVADTAGIFRNNEKYKIGFRYHEIIPWELREQMKAVNITIQPEYIHDDISIYLNDGFNSAIDMYLNLNNNEKFLNIPLVRYFLAVFVRNNIELNNLELTEHNILNELSGWFKVFDKTKNNVIIDNKTNLILINAKESWDSGKSKFNNKSFLSVLDLAKISIPAKNIKSLLFTGENVDDASNLLRSIDPGKKYFIKINGHGYSTYHDYIISGDYMDDSSGATADGLTGDAIVDALKHAFDKGVKSEDITICFDNCYSDFGARVIAVSLINAGYSSPNIISVAGNVQPYGFISESGSLYDLGLQRYVENNNIKNALIIKDFLLARIFFKTHQSQIYPAQTPDEFAILNAERKLIPSELNLNERMDKNFGEVFLQEAGVSVYSEDTKKLIKKLIFFKLNYSAAEGNQITDFFMKVEMRRAFLKVKNLEKAINDLDHEGNRLKNETDTMRLFNFSNFNYGRFVDIEKDVGYIRLTRENGEIKAEVTYHDGNKVMYSAVETERMTENLFKKIIFDIGVNEKPEKYKDFINEFMGAKFMNNITAFNETNIIITRGFDSALLKKKNIDLNNNKNKIRVIPTPPDDQRYYIHIMPNEIAELFSPDKKEFYSSGYENEEDGIEDASNRFFKYKNHVYIRLWLRSGDFLRNSLFFSIILFLILSSPALMIPANAYFILLSPLIPAMLYYTAKAGSLFSIKIREKFNLKKPFYETHIFINKKLNIEYDETLKKGEYFYADTEKKVIKANKQIFDIYNALPLPASVKKFLLYASGVIGHEVKHLLGFGEGVAYGFQFGMYTFAIISALFISLLSPAAFIAAAIILPFLFIYADGLISNFILKYKNTDTVFIMLRDYNAQFEHKGGPKKSSYVIISAIDDKVNIKKELFKKLYDGFEVSVYICFDKANDRYYFGFKTDKEVSSRAFNIVAGDIFKMLSLYRGYVNELNRLNGKKINSSSSTVLISDIDIAKNDSPVIMMEDILSVYNKKFNKLTEREKHELINSIKKIKKSEIAAKRNNLALEVKLAEIAELTESEAVRLVAQSHRKGITSFKIVVDEKTTALEISLVLKKIRAAETSNASDRSLSQISEIIIEIDGRNPVLAGDLNTIKQAYINEIIVNMSETAWKTARDLIINVENIINKNPDFIFNFKAFGAEKNISVAGKNRNMEDLNKLFKSNIFITKERRELVILPSTFGSLKELLGQKGATFSKLYSSIIQEVVNLMEDTPQGMFDKAMLLDTSDVVNKNILNDITEIVKSNDFSKQYFALQQDFNINDADIDSAIAFLSAIDDLNIGLKNGFEFKKLLNKALNSKSRTDIEFFMAFTKGMVFAGLEKEFVKNDRFADYNLRVNFAFALMNIRFGQKPSGENNFSELKIELSEKSLRLSWIDFQGHLYETIKDLENEMFKNNPNAAAMVYELLMLYAERESKIEIRDKQVSLDMNSIKLILSAA